MATLDQIPLLYAITDAHATDAHLFDQVEQALRGGCRWLQYRDKSADSSRRLHQAQQLHEICTRYNATLIINDDPRLAKACAAQGVHLGQTDMPIVEARALLGPEAIIGATCHASLELALASQAAGADYVAFGRFFPSSTKPDASPAPLSLIPRAKAVLQVPLVVIGGINLEKAPQLLNAGADCLAVCEGLFHTADIQERAREFMALRR